MGVEQIMQAVMVTAELTGANLSAAAQAMMVKDLADFPEDRILKAFDRFRREGKGRLNLPGIIALIEDEDGRPSADEAWAMCPRSEGDSVFWTTEIQTALGIARPVLESGDKIGARMAFRDAYERLVREARAQNRRPDWSLSIGWDKAGREEAVSKAVARGLISQQAAQQYLPAPESSLSALIEGKATTLALTDATQDEHEQFARGVAMIRNTLDTLNQRSAERRAEEQERERQRALAFEAERTRQLNMAAERMKQEGGAA